MLEIRPLGVSCPLACTYCYQEPIRVAGNRPAPTNWEKIIEVIDRVGHDFSLFGGEALLTPKKHLRMIWEYGYKKFGVNSIQTNGMLIDDDHIAMFKEFNVNVGVSIDGPGELNSLRVIRGKEKDEQATLANTDRIMQNIVKCREAGVNMGIIITLHRLNGTPDKLPRLMKFIDWLGDIGIVHGNLHVLEVNPTMPDQDKHVLTQEENIEAMLTLARFFEERPKLRWNPFAEIPDILQGRDDKALCTWKSCDPMDTQAVYGVEGDGSLSNCGRTNKEGIDWYKTDRHAYGRYISFYYTPDEMGGCQGCRFWIACGGSCPGESAQNDFRNKTIHCRTQKALLGFYEERLEERGITPITKSRIRPEIEKVMLDLMSRGDQPTIGRCLHIIRQMRERPQPPNAVLVPVKPQEGSN